MTELSHMQMHKAGITIVGVIEHASHEKKTAVCKM